MLHIVLLFFKNDSNNLMELGEFEDALKYIDLELSMEKASE